MTLTTDLGLSTCLNVPVCETGDWDLFLCPLEWALFELTGIEAKSIPRDWQGLSTPVSLGYPLSVFTKNSTLKQSPDRQLNYTLIFEQ